MNERAMVVLAVFRMPYRQMKIGFALMKNAWIGSENRKKFGLLSYL